MLGRAEPLDAADTEIFSSSKTTAAKCENFQLKATCTHWCPATHPSHACSAVSQGFQLIPACKQRDSVKKIINNSVDPPKYIPDPYLSM